MSRERYPVRALGVAVLLVAALGLGLFLGAPVAVAQEDPSTTVLEDDLTETTVTESGDKFGETEDSTSGDHDCGDRAKEQSSVDSSLTDE